MRRAIGLYIDGGHPLHRRLRAADADPASALGDDKASREGDAPDGRVPQEGALHQQRANVHVRVEHPRLPHRYGADATGRAARPAARAHRAPQLLAIGQPARPGARQGA
eukprot:scaffold8648_cov126-Isochrysis_galbana.AAC.6